MDKFVKKVDGDFSFEAFSPSLADKFTRLVNDNGADDELASAIAWVMENIPQTSLAAECAQRTPTDIKALIEKGKSGVLSAGSLSALDLHATAVSTLDTGRISHLLTNSTTLASLQSMIGKIIINASVWDGNCFSGLIRADKDAEVQTLCLVAFWCKNEQVSAACADLTFDFRALGLGSKQRTATLKLLDVEDKFRAVMGISGWRKVALYHDISKMMIAEGRFADKGVDQGERLITLLKEDGADPGKINADTMKRHIALGRRVCDENVKAIILKWLLGNKRETLVDAISVLRGVCSATENDADLATILKELMMQQRAGVRRQLVTPRSNNDQCTPVNISKGIILRNNLYTHVLAIFPKHAEMITRYVSATYYRERFGVDENGVMSDPP